MASSLSNNQQLFSTPITNTTQQPVFRSSTSGDYVNLSDLNNDYTNEEYSSLMFNNNNNHNVNLNDSCEYQALKIKTKSIENALLPLVTQVSILYWCFASLFF